MSHAAISGEMRQCIQHCLDCWRICEETISHCLSLGGAHSSAPHIRELMDCVEICHTAASFMLRGSPEHTRTCAVCAEVCRKCAESCERIAAGDHLMLECAGMCRRCATSCESMAAVHA